MLYHHDGRGYAEAASAAALHAKTKMYQTIEEGRASAANTIQRVMTEVPSDYVVKTMAVRFGSTGEDVRLHIPDQDPLSISGNALTQLCTRADIPIAMYRKLIGNEETAGWGPELMSTIFNECYSHQNERYLARAYNTRLRGWLSTNYRRLDSRPIFDRFLGDITELGMVPVAGYASETKVMMKALLPVVFEPAMDEVICFGISLENSDYGNGALSVRVFVLRLWCTNFAIADEGIRQIHLGRKISDNFEFSERTYQLDTETTVSAVSDVIKGSLSPNRVECMVDAIANASMMELEDPRKYMETFRNLLTKGERQAIVERFNTPDVELLPPGNTLWRMSNAISLFANEIEDPERKIELMKISGNMIPNLAEAA